jgi:predicted O-linked N-acetylglucosamine transferase (SPINDLY family)
MFENMSWIDADYRTALGHLEAGRLADAELMLRAVIAMAPHYTPAWMSLGLALQRTENVAAAVDCFANLTQLDPNMFDGWIQLSNSLSLLGRKREAAAALTSAAQCNPTPAIYEMVAKLHLEAGNGQDAITAATKAFELDPSSASIAHLLGFLHLQQSQRGEAAACFRRSTELAPELADPWAHLGIALQLQGQLEDAHRAYSHALELVPSHRLAALNLASLLMTRGALAESRQLVDTMMAQGQETPDLLRIAGDQARHDGRAADAIELYRRALESQPDNPETLNGLGQVLQSAGQIQEAVDVFAHATKAAPRDSRAWSSLGAILSATGQLDQAALYYRTALSLDPRQPGSAERLASILLNLGQPAEALSLFEHLATLNVAPSLAESRILHCLAFLPEVDASILAPRLRGWGEALAAQVTPIAHDAPKPDEAARILRIGYLLPDLSRNPLCGIVGPLFAAHDRNEVALFGYTMTPNEASLSPSLARSLENWRLMAGAKGQDILAQMRRDAIDVLVDVNGHWPPHGLELLAHRPAPVQISWPLLTGLGTGLASIEAMIGDETLIPDAQAMLFVERVARPFPVFCCYRGDDAATEASPLPCAAGTGVTFGYVGEPARLNDRVVAAWAEILTACPDATLRLDHVTLRQPGPQEHVRARFATHGIAGARIVAGFSPSSSAAWSSVDIALDPFPASAGAAMLEGLWMGVPAVTLTGTLPSARFGTAILPHVGLQDWVTDTVEAYVARAIAAARDLATLEALRRGLRQALLASPLGDARGFAAALEATYRGLWQDRCRAP